MWSDASVFRFWQSRLSLDRDMLQGLLSPIGRPLQYISEDIAHDECSPELSLGRVFTQRLNVDVRNKWCQAISKNGATKLSLPNPSADAEFLFL
jgi:hypothetical protein